MSSYLLRGSTLQNWHLPPSARKAYRQLLWNSPCAAAMLHVAHGPSPRMFSTAYAMCDGFYSMSDQDLASIVFREGAVGSLKRRVSDANMGDPHWIFGNKLIKGLKDMTTTGQLSEEDAQEKIALIRALLYPDVSTVLLLNSGEAAATFADCAQRRGLEVLAFICPTSKGYKTAELADETFPIKSYMEEKVIHEKLRSFAKEGKRVAVYPGIGHLSESPELSALCEELNFPFLGPPSVFMARVSSKLDARNRLDGVVPMIPGFGGQEKVQDANVLQKEADRIGYPLMVKAASGGGGRGIVECKDSQGFQEVLKTVQATGERLFNDRSVVLERKIINTKHFEVNVLAELDPTRPKPVINLFSPRDCTTQKQNMKQHECSAMLPDHMREKLITNARKVMEAMLEGASTNHRKVFASTVEFLSEGEEVYFLEVNPRLQQESKVTELQHDISFADEMMGAIDPWYKADIGSLAARAKHPFSIQTRIHAYMVTPKGPLPSPNVRLDPNVLRQIAQSGHSQSFWAIPASNEWVSVDMMNDPMIGKLVTTAPSPEEGVQIHRYVLRQLQRGLDGSDVAQSLKVLHSAEYKPGMLAEAYTKLYNQLASTL